jgi:hypothetical protein
MALRAAFIKIMADIAYLLGRSFSAVEVLKINRPMFVFIKPSQA